MYLTQSLKRAIQINGSGLATSAAGRERSWSECGERVAKLAGALAGLGVGTGDRVAILALNSDRYLEFFYAVPWAGAVFVPVNTRLAPPEIAYWLGDSGTKVLFIDDPFLDSLAALEGQLPALETVVYLGNGATPEGMLNYEEILAAAAPADDALRCDDDLAGILYTGGTTGRSKGVMLSHRNLYTNTLNEVPALNFRFGVRYMQAAPLFHIAGSAMIFGVTMVGGTHFFLDRFTPEAALGMIQEHRITASLLVPTMINMMVNHPDLGSYDLSSLEDIVYGASPMPEAVILKAMQVIPHCRYTHAYGQTECAPLITTIGPEYHVLEGPNAGRFKSAGRVVLGAEVKIVDADDRELARGEQGELCVRGPIVMLGYWNMPEATAEALKGGWMHTGDAAFIDDEGFVYITDRVKDMIITGAENVYSIEVENAIYRHPQVLECAVIGIPHDTWGEQVHAIVRLADGASVEAEEIIEHCHGLIAGFKSPKSVDFVTEPLPLSGANKILKAELRKPFWEGKEKRVN